MHHENEDQLIQHLGCIADNLKEIDRGMPSLDCDFPTLYEVELYLSQISNYTGCVNDRLIEAVGLPRNNFCLACFTGDYPIPVQLEMDKLALETIAGGQQKEVCDAVEDK